MRASKQLGRRAPRARALLTHLYQNPVLSGARLAATLKVSQLTADRLIAAFVAEGWLKEITGGRRDRMFAFEPYLALFRE